MSKLSIFMCIFAFITFYDNILAENGENVFKIALNKQPKFQRNTMNVAQDRNNAVDIVKLHDVRNIAYTTTIKLGSPPQELVVQIDTGSSTFWVYGQDCCGDSWRKCPADCALKNEFSNCPSNCQYKFFPSESSTFQPTNNYFDQGYVDGNGCSGPMGKDTLQIGSLKIPNTNFGVANKSSHRLEKQPNYHGLIGMAFLQISRSMPQKVESPLFEAMNQKLLDENLFTIFMKSSPNGGVLDAGGELTIGGIDHENCDDIINWVDLVNQDDGFWQFPIDSVRYGNDIIDSSNIAVSDTGSSSVLGPEEIVIIIHEQIDLPPPLPYLFTEIPCDKEYDPIMFKIAGRHYKLTKEMLTIKNVSNHCLFALGINPKDRKWILGDPFIRQYCHIHDMAKKRIGFGELKNN